MCKLTEIVSVWTKPAQVQARWGPGTERGKWTWGPTLNQEAICN